MYGKELFSVYPKSLWLEKVDGRRHEARRCRDILQGFVDELGGAKIFADVFWLDQDEADRIGSVTDNEGVGFLIGAGVKF